MGQYDWEALIRHLQFPFTPASTTAARGLGVFSVRPLMLALDNNGQLFIMLLSRTDDLFGLNNRVHSVESKLIDGFVVDHIANPDFTRACANQCTDTVINFHIQLARITNEDEFTLAKPFHQAGDLFDLVIVGPAERAANGIYQE